MQPPHPAELWKKYGLRFKKSLGQNFLLDPNINRKMVETARVGAGDQVFEVGAGIGELTSFLAATGAYVFTTEIDTSFAPVLCERFAQTPNVRIFIGDVLLFDIAELVATYFAPEPPIKMVSNLPYYITAPILQAFLATPAAIESLTVMVQREVAERLVAGPNSKAYSILTVATKCYARASIVRYVPRTVFRPRPNVDSAIVHLRRQPPLVPDAERDWFFRVVRAAFGQRRKTLRNALQGGPLKGLAREQVLAALQAADIHPDRRGESLSFEELAAVARHLPRL